MNTPVPGAELQLRDIHLPAEPSWWPPAPGWWLLAILVVAALVLLARFAWRKYRERRRRAALRAEFDAAAKLGDPAARVAAVSALLRRAALAREPSAAALSGDAWLRFLDAGSGAFTRGPGRALLDAPYRPHVDAATADALVVAARPRFLELAGP